MLRTISAFVETPFYVVAAALVIFVAVFWFALRHERSLLLPLCGRRSLPREKNDGRGSFRTYGRQWIRSFLKLFSFSAFEMSASTSLTNCL